MRLPLHYICTSPIPGLRYCPNSQNKKPFHYKDNIRHCEPTTPAQHYRHNFPTLRNEKELLRLCNLASLYYLHHVGTESGRYAFQSAKASDTCNTEYYLRVFCLQYLPAYSLPPYAPPPYPGRCLSSMSDKVVHKKPPYQNPPPMYCLSHFAHIQAFLVVSAEDNGQSHVFADSCLSGKQPHQNKHSPPGFHSKSLLSKNKDGHRQEAFRHKGYRKIGHLSPFLNPKHPLDSPSNRPPYLPLKSDKQSASPPVHHLKCSNRKKESA